MDTFKDTKICIIGAGFGGLTAALKLKQELKCENFVIYDKNDDVGGCWLTNVYPDCACDFPSHYYCWSFEPNPGWSKNFAEQPEILEYIQNTVRKNGLYSKFQGSMQVEALTWNPAVQMWEVDVTNLKDGTSQTNYFNFVYIGITYLWQLNQPEIFKKFEGRLVHTGKWDLEENELVGKVVGVVGTGASGVQVLPSLAQKASSLHLFQRHPGWVLPKVVQDYSEWTKWMWKNIPGTLKAYRWALFWKYLVFSDVVKKRSLLRGTVTKGCEGTIRKTCPERFEKIIPKYTLGCKVVAFSDSYYEALNSPNVHIHNESISNVKGKEINLEGVDESIKLDVLVLATGYKPQLFFHPLKIYGLDSRDIGKEWVEDRPRNYLGISTSTAPNLFFLAGPYSVLTSSTGIYVFECHVNWSLQVIRHIVKNGYNSFVIKEETENEFIKDIDKKYEDTIVPNLECESWLVNERNIPTVVFPGTGFEFWRRTRKFNPMTCHFH